MGSLDLHMEVARAPRIQTRDDGRQTKATFLVSELVAAQPEPDIVVVPVAVGVPEVDEHVREGTAVAGKYPSGELDPGPLDPGLEERRP